MEDTPVETDRRTKRQKLDKGGRFAALKKLKDLKEKGVKNKYDVDEVNNVYDTVDEDEYTKRVQKRQDDDWIVDEGAHGYVEDGREVFDDDLDSESIAQASSKKSRGKKRKKAVSDNVSKGNIQFMLSNIQPKKNKEDTNLGADDTLSELISELNDADNDDSANMSATCATSSIIAEKIAAKNYTCNFSVSSPSLKISKSHIKSVKLSRSQQKQQQKPQLTDSILDKTADKETFEQEAREEESSTCLASKSYSKADLPSEVDKENNSPVPVHLENSFVNETEDMFDDDLDMSHFDPESGEVLEAEASKAFQEPITEDKLESGWETMLETFANNTDVPEEPESANVSVIADEDSKHEFVFYWWDAYENKAAQPGVVLLFGKTYSEQHKSYVSCCVAVRNVERKIFLLPRTHNRKTNEPTTMPDLYREFNESFAKKHEISSFKTRKITKKFAFDPDVPSESEYLEIRYSAKYPSLLPDASGNTFSRAFGTNSNFLEILLLERKIKGPCWLKVTNSEPATTQISWCQLEMNCVSTADISVVNASKPMPPPPLTVMAINARSIINPKQMKNEIIMISCLVHSNYCVDKGAPNPPFQQHFCVVRPTLSNLLPPGFHKDLANYKATNVQKTDNARAMYNLFLKRLAKIDPDLIVGHDLHGYQLNLLCEGLLACNVKNMSQFGKVRRYFARKDLREAKRTLFAGRLICDLKVSLKELIKSRSYDLDALCSEVLKLKPGQRIDIEPEDTAKMYESSADIFKLISLTMQDTAFVLKMMYEMNVIPLSLQITNIAGNVLSKTLLGGRAERNEFLLLHAFYEKDYIVPDRRVKNNEKVTGSNYSGGLVLDPMVGYYDKMILLMDFNSLYPSIIQEYNICFTTVSETEDYEPNCSASGVLPTEIRKLVESRREVKKLMKSPDLPENLRAQYNVRQTALKLTANSMYGCLGFQNSRFYAMHLAELVTRKGREILTNTKELVEKMSYEVIYGDTDSIMINTKSEDYDSVLKVGNKIKAEINKRYRQIELDVDGVFRYLLLLKKKKYAAVTLSRNQRGELQSEHEYKGLDFVRRDWCPLTAEAGKFVLKHVLSDLQHDEKVAAIKTHLEVLKSDLEQHSVPLPLLVITKQLTKNPAEYAGAQNQAHVSVALRYNSKIGSKPLRSGDTVPYVICDSDGGDLPVPKRAHHVEEFKKHPSLKVDVKYYLSQQIYPVISRLCEPIADIDRYEIAECLGLESNIYRGPKEADKKSIHAFSAPEEKFQSAQRFVFTCRNCATKSAVVAGELIKCTSPNCDVHPLSYLPSIQNELQLFVRKCVRDYYKNKFICEDPLCTYETERLPVKLVQGQPVCPSCTDNRMFRKYTAKDLGLQFLFLQHVFEPNNLRSEINDANITNGYKLLQAIVNNFMAHSSYTSLSLKNIFEVVSRGASSPMELFTVMIEE